MSFDISLAPGFVSQFRKQPKRRRYFGTPNRPHRGRETEHGSYSAARERPPYLSVGTVARENCTRGLQENLHVQDWGPRPRILQIQAHHLVEGRLASPLHLP